MNSPFRKLQEKWAYGVDNLGRVDTGLLGHYPLVTKDDIHYPSTWFDQPQHAFVDEDRN
jgi:hypothetical protein